MEERNAKLERAGLRYRNIFALLLFALAIAGCRGGWRPIYEVQNTPYITGSSDPTFAQVKAAIFRGGLKRNWKMEYVAEGHFVATQAARRGTVVVVDIEFNTKGFSITYNSSKRIKFRCDDRSKKEDCRIGKIQALYNQWVKALEKDILVSLSKL